MYSGIKLRVIEYICTDISEGTLSFFYVICHSHETLKSHVKIFVCLLLTGSFVIISFPRDTSTPPGGRGDGH
jgi:hypothetical protein